MTHLPHARRITLTLVLIALIIGPVSTVRALDYRVEEAMVPMPDQVGLLTQIWLPQENGAHPTILVRTTYGIKNISFIAEHLAPHGYAVVVQNVRGKDGSEGDFFPFVYEKQDGMATLEWALQQPWCNGDIGLWGVSYLGFAAHEIASTGHPAVKTMMYISSWSDLEPFMMPGGAFHLQAHLPWFIMFAAGETPPAEAWPQIFRATPLMQFFQGAAEPMQQAMSGEYDYSNYRASILHISGWYDYLYENTLQTYQGITASAPNAGEQRLMVGVWPHNDALNGKTNAGELDFGEDAKWGIEYINDLSRQWFDLKLKGTENELATKPAVKLFVMGANEWRTFSSWPDAAVSATNWYVNSKEKANGIAGSGSLADQQTKGRDSDSFVYDPNDPVPTSGGANSNFFQSTLGVFDQAEVERREDVLVYTSAPLEEPLTLVGPVQAHVYAATEGLNTDFTAKLVEVRADGYARNITDGIVRASHQFGLDSANMLEPGKVYEYEVDMGATAIELPAGSRVRLEISSSNFPKFDRNPNTAVDPMEATEFVPVTQTVYHSEEYPTHVVLPVMGDEAKRSER